MTFCTFYYCPSSGLTLSRGSLVLSCYTKKVHSLFILWPFVTSRPTKTRFLSNVYKGMKIYHLDFHVEKYVLFGSISFYDFFYYYKNNWTCIQKLVVLQPVTFRYRNIANTFLIMTCEL